VRLMAIVGDGPNGRVYCSPTEEHEHHALKIRADWRPDQPMDARALGFRVPEYGLATWGDLFTERQLVTLTTFSDLVMAARDRVLADAETHSFSSQVADTRRLADGGLGAVAYADAVATYLAFAVDKASDRNSTLCVWEANMNRMRNTFGRQALPMVWDYAETNPLSGAGGDIAGCANAVYEVLNKLNQTSAGSV
jgi:putative DNA methylase